MKSLVVLFFIFSLSLSPFSVLASSNIFKIDSVCTSTLSELELNQYELSGLCVPKNVNLKNPEPQYPGSYVKGTTEVSSTTQVFSWTQIPDAITYSLYVRNEDTGILEVDKEGLISTSYEVTNLKPSNHYRWNVRAKGSDGRGGWLSELYYFSVSSTATDTDNDNTAIEFQFVDENGNPLSSNDIEILPVECYPVHTDECTKQINLQGIPEIVNGVVTLYRKTYKFTEGVTIKVREKWFDTVQVWSGKFIQNENKKMTVQVVPGGSCSAGDNGTVTDPIPPSSENEVLVISEDRWVSQFDPRFGTEDQQKVACFKAMNITIGYTPSPENRIKTVVYENDVLMNKLILTPDARKGVDVVDDYIMNKKEPITVGVNAEIGRDERNGNNGGNKATNHFIIIVGYGTDEKGRYYRFFDPGTSFKDLGVHKSNKLYIDGNTSLVTGIPARKKINKVTNEAESLFYYLTEVRPKEKN